MVIGESKVFTVDANGTDISEYTATCNLLKDRNLIRTESVDNDGTQFTIKLQTKDLTAGSYEIRVFITDPVDGGIDVARAEFILEA